MATKERIAKAVNDPDWQNFRLSLKGKDTVEKLILLDCYMLDPENASHRNHSYGEIDTDQCDVCIRVDNYLKALCRGGQIWSGTDLLDLIEAAKSPNPFMTLVKRER